MDQAREKNSRPIKENNKVNQRIDIQIVSRIIDNHQEAEK
jgi:hypothetical protein